MADHWDAEKAAAPDSASLRDADDQLNAAGNKIMNLLHEAAGVAESKNARRDEARAAPFRRASGS